MHEDIAYVLRKTHVSLLTGKKEGMPHNKLKGYYIIVNRKLYYPQGKLDFFTGEVIPENLECVYDKYNVQVAFISRFSGVVVRTLKRS